jgi:dUTP pyrophosphatase
MNIDLKILPELANNTAFDASPELQAYKQHGPTYATDGSAGLDLRACINSPMHLSPGQSVIVPAGFAMHIDHNEVAALLLPRSGLGSNKGIVLGNLVGLIDEDYQGGVGICLWNRSSHTATQINPGDKVCQMVFVPIIKAAFNPVSEFKAKTERGAGGFGSTDLRA